LWLFKAYHEALASSDPKVRQLAERASLRTQWKPNSGLGHDVNHVLADFIAACKAKALPAVSWIVAPYAYSEHPAARPVDGAAYTQTVLNAIWSQPDLWEKTAVFINYDEHDGFFDHLISPTAPAGTGTHDGGIAVEPRRLDQLRGLRPHVGVAFPGTVDRGQGTQHFGVAPEHLR
jgi:phospholipase C